MSKAMANSTSPSSSLFLFLLLLFLLTLLLLFLLFLLILPLVFNQVLKMLEDRGPLDTELLTKFAIHSNEVWHKPLLNNKDLDPDLNYYMDSAFDSNYYGPNQLHHKFQNLPDAFSLMHLNCRSLIPKVNDLLSLLQLLPVKIAALTETWLTDELASSISVPGYQLIHKSRESDRYGGVGFLTGLTLLKFTHPKLPLTNTLDALARNQLQNLGTA